MTFNSQILDCDDSSWVENITQRVRASTSVRLNFLSILHEKTYLFYFTYPLLQNIHISLSILHIYSIKYSLFYNFLLFTPSLPLSLTDPQLPSPPSSPPSQIITHPIGGKIIKTHQWTRKAKLIKIKTHQPTPTINQKTRKNGSKPTSSRRPSASTKVPRSTTARKAKPIKIKTHQPTPTINQKTRKNGSKPTPRDGRWSQPKCLAAPPPPHDGRRLQAQPKMDQNP